MIIVGKIDLKHVKSPKSSNVAKKYERVKVLKMKLSGTYMYI